MGSKVMEPQRGAMIVAGLSGEGANGSSQSFHTLPPMSPDCKRHACKAIQFDLIEIASDQVAGKSTQFTLMRFQTAEIRFRPTKS
jgi:hypothetical protein